MTRNYLMYFTILYFLRYHVHLVTCAKTKNQENGEAKKVQKSNRKRRTIFSLSPSPIYVHIQGMALVDVAYLCCVVGLIPYYNEIFLKNPGGTIGTTFDRSTQEIIFYVIVPTANAFKGCLC